MADLSEQLRQALSSSYAIERELGRGGMATVYLARDLKHDRHVAVKVLNPELGAVLGVERFLAEIKVTANLQHPNLLPLFDSGSAGGQLYYVMPFVDGESLRGRLDRERQLPIDEAVRITIAVGNALDYAHAHGVIHRDLKPENILMQHGQAVIADFGIALAISNAGGARVTQTGLSLGTPQYMSPEQATGDRVIDGRSDIYSLGAILYEMLTGEPPHTGNTVQATIAKVLTDPVKPLRSYRDTVPVQIELATAKALAKLPADRFANAGAFVRALEGDTTGLRDAATLTTARRPSFASWIRHPASVGLGAVAVAAIAFAARNPDGAIGAREARTVRFRLATPGRAELYAAAGHLVDVSPDGRTVAMLVRGPAGGALWIQDLAQGALRPLETPALPGAPTFTPDGEALVVRSNVDLFRVPLSGGSPQRLWPATSTSHRFAFIGRDSLIFSDDGSVCAHLYVGSLSGGAPARLLRNDSTAESHCQRSAVMAPDGNTLFFISTQIGGQNPQFGFVTLSDRRLRSAPVAVFDFVGYAAGRVLYVNTAGAVMALGFDLKRQEIVGQPVPTGESIRANLSGGAKVTLNALGDLAFIGDAGTSKPVLVGGGRNPQSLGANDRVYLDARISPDGRLIAFSVRDAGQSDVWIFNSSSGSLDRISAPGRSHDRVEWSPDSRRVLYRSDADGTFSIWWQPIDGSAPAERLSPTSITAPVQEAVVTPDGKTLVFRIDVPAGVRDIHAVPIGGDGKVVPVLATPADELLPRISPDGKWMAYVSSESGSDEVYVRPFPGPGGRTIVSVGGGGEPQWSRDQKRVIYRSGQAVIGATLTLGSAPVVTRRDTLATGNFVSSRLHTAYDIAADGRLLMLQSTQEEVQPTIVLNWGAGLAARLGPVKP